VKLIIFVSFIDKKFIQVILWLIIKWLREQTLTRLTIILWSTAANWLKTKVVDRVALHCTIMVQWSYYIFMILCQHLSWSFFHTYMDML